MLRGRREYGTEQGLLGGHVSIIQLDEFWMGTPPILVFYCSNIHISMR